MKTRIRGRIFVPVLLVLLLLPIAVCLVFRQTAESYLRGASVEELSGMMQRLLPQIQEIFNSPDSTAQEQTQAFEARLTYIRTSGEDSFVILLTEQFETIYPAKLEEQYGAQAILDAFRTGKAAVPQRFQNSLTQELTLDGQLYLVCLHQFSGNTGGLVRYAIAYHPIYEMNSFLDGVTARVLLITASLSAAALIAMWLVAGSIAKPIHRLRDHAARIGGGDFTSRGEVCGLEELDELSQTLDDMALRLDRSSTAQKMFYQNASHELRTPLMSINGYAQGIQYGVFEDPKEAAETIMSESTRLTKLVDSILTLSRLDNENQAVDLQPIRLADFLAGYVKKLEGLALSQGVSIGISECADTLYVTADEELFAGALTNVVANAIRYAKTAVALRAFPSEGMVRVYVIDDGPGFPPDRADRLFDRFYKGKSGNFGLGLSIAKSSMEYIGGSIHAYNGLTGAVFELTLRQCDPPLS